MPIDPTVTRTRLMRAGERLFAERGVHTAGVRDIVQAGGQANTSAVHYHFGSREGLVLAICGEHIGRMEPERLRRVDAYTRAPSLDRLLTDMIEPTAGELDDESGRCFLRIVAQLVTQAAVRRLIVPTELGGVALRRQLNQLDALCIAKMPREVALERSRLIVTMIATEFAFRAWAIDHREPMMLDHDAFLDNLVMLLVSALNAPVAATTAGRSRAVEAARDARDARDAKSTGASAAFFA